MENNATNGLVLGHASWPAASHRRSFS